VVRVLRERGSGRRFKMRSEALARCQGDTKEK